MVKRINTYLKEMYPVIPRLILSGMVYFALYFLVVLVYKVKITEIGMDDATAILTTFLFWLFLRIADEFKDRESDLRLFPERVYPSGRVHTKDLVVLMTLDIIIMAAINIIYPTGLLWFAFLFGYGILMSFWFFMKKYIQPNLILALITHNPVQLILNYYLTAIVCAKYNLEMFTLNIFCINLMLYIPGLEWEISRKIKAPRDENDYMTYSKIFGYKKASVLLLFVSLCELAIGIYIAAKIAHIVFLVILVIFYILLCKKVYDFIKYPESRKNRIGIFTQAYIYAVQSTLIALTVAALIKI